MANQKAQKLPLPFPPLLNLAENKPEIDTSFQSWDKTNGPFLNEMLQPVWIQDTGAEAVYTKNGNRYEIRGTEVWLNGKGTGVSVGDHYFTKSRIDYLKNSIDFALDPNTNDIYDLRYEPGVNGGSAHLVLYKNDTLLSYTAALNTTKSSTAARVKVLSNGAVLTAMLINEPSRTFTHFHLYRDGTGTEIGGSDYWYRQVIGVGRAVSGSDIRIDLQGFGTKIDVDPIINIGEIDGSRVGVSFVSSYGEVTNTYNSTFITSILNIDTKVNSVITQLLTRNNTTAINYTDTENIVVTNRLTGNDTTYYYINKDGKWWKYDTETNTIASEPTEMPDGILPSKTTYRDSTGTYMLYATRVTEGTTSLTFTSSNVSGSYTAKAKVSIELPKGQILAVTKGTMDADGYITSSGTGQVVLEYKRFRFANQTIKSTWVPDSMSITTSGQTFPIPPEQMSGFSINVNKSYSGVSGAAFLPCIFNDDGRLSAIFAFNPMTTSFSTNSFDTTYQNAVTLGAFQDHNGNVLRINPLATSNSLRNGCQYMRSASFIVNQEFSAMTYKLCNAAAATPASLNTSGNETSSSQFLEATFSNRYGLRYNPGTSRNTRYNYYSAVAGPYADPSLTGNQEDALVYTVQGYRNPIHYSGNKSSPFNILYNVTAAGYAYIQGISYSKQPNALGTLLTPWQTINENSYVTASPNRVIYKDGLGDIWQISIVEGTPPMTTLLDDRYVVFNTTEYVNCIDSETGKYYHYATDYNGRMAHGSSAANTVSGVITVNGKTEQFPHIRYTANGINPLYTVMPRDAIMSTLLPQVGRYRCNVNEEVLYDCVIDSDNKNSQGCDVFWSNYSDTRCVYRKTMYGVGLISYKKELDGLQYPGTTATTASLTPNIFTRFINGAGNNDMVIDGYDAFTLSYYDNKPFFVYSRSTQVSTTYDESDAFFVLQGQYYGVINDKICALVYNGGAIAQMDAVIDIRGLKFLGNNPQIAFFWDKAAKTIKSFTGDGILQAIWDATGLGDVLGGRWYDETTQTIYIATSKGLLVLGPKNNYMHTNWQNVTYMTFDENGTTHLTNDGVTYNLRYYKTEGYEVLPLDLETQFFGTTPAGNISIDNFKITLYDLDGDKPSSWITVGVRSLTDCSVRSEEKTFKITPDMWDSFSKSCLISYNPAIIKGQGLRLYLKTPMIVSSIVASLMENQQQTLTKHTI